MDNKISEASDNRENSAILQREYIKEIAAGAQRTEQTVLGSALMGERIFVASSGNVTDEVIAEYIRTQDIEERQRGDDFQISEL